MWKNTHGPEFIDSFIHTKHKRSDVGKLLLSKRDRDLIRYFRDPKRGVLLEVQAHLIDESHGTIMVTCADGDQMTDVYRHHEGVCMHHRDDPRIHLLSLNGGAKLIAKSSPLRVGDEDTLLLKHMQFAREMKKMETVVLYAHAPCGVAYGHDLSFAEVLELLFEGKERVKCTLSEIKVACFCHIDYGDGRKRTYFVSRDAWIAWKEKHPESTYS